MVGLHVFEITVVSNDPVEPDKKLYLEVTFQPQEAKSDTPPPPENRNVAP